MIATKLIRQMLSTNLSSRFQSVHFVRNCRRYTYCLGAIHLKSTKTPLEFKDASQYFMAAAAPGTNFRPFVVDHKRFYASVDRKNLDLKLEKSKQILTENIELKRQQMRERKEILVQGIRDKKTKVQAKVRQMEEIVERENILTIPNLLCVARGFLSPYIGYVIVQENYQLAIGLLVFAGITDLVRLTNVSL